MSLTDDQRLRELTTRLVTMAPEPPPFPEETTIAAAGAQTRRVNPVLIFAGGAALVLLGAAIPLLLWGSGNGEAPAGPTVPPVVTTMPTAVSTLPGPSTVPPTTPDPTDTTIPQLETYDTVLFLVTDPVGSFSGNPSLVPFHTTVAIAGGADLDLVSAATLQLLANPDQTVEPLAGFYNAVPADVEIYDAKLLDVGGEDVLQVEVSETFAAGAGGLLADITMLNQIVYTATWWSPDMNVRFVHEGEVVDSFGTEGLLIGDGVGRDDFLDQMSLIVITEPLILGGDELPRVSGVANVYEATVSMRIVWAESGEVVYEDFTTATCGTGCWGDFSFTLDIPGLESGQLVQVFWNSPEDGAMRDLVTYSVGPDGAPWDLFPDPRG